MNDASNSKTRTWKRWTAMTAVLAAGITLAVNVLAIAFGGDDAALSVTINEAVYGSTIAAFASGALAGGLIVHWLAWSPKRGMK